MKKNEERVDEPQYNAILALDREFEKIFSNKKKKEKFMEKNEKIKLYKKGEDYFADEACSDKLDYIDNGVFWSCLTGEEFTLDECEIVEV